MLAVIPLLAISILAGVGIAVFFWMQIKAERNAATACMACRQQMEISGKRECPRCRLMVCLSCWEKNQNCPNCKTTWHR